MNIIFSKHARERITERGISVQEVTEAIARGSKRIQNSDKIISDYKYFSVVYRKIEENAYVITVKPRW